MGDHKTEQDHAEWLEHCGRYHQRLVDALEMITSQMENEDDHARCADNIVCDATRRLLIELGSTRGEIE